MVVQPIRSIAEAPARATPVPMPAGPSSPPRGRSAWKVLVLLAILAASGGAIGFVLRPAPVEIVKARTGEAVDAVYASGVVEYVRQARVAPVVTAPIREVFVAEGQSVRSGAVLAQLEDGPQRATAAQLDAQAGQARIAAERTQRLLDVAVGSAAANDDAQAQRKASEAAAASARALLAHYRLVAPFAGRVLRRDAEPGDMASLGAPMFVIADPASLRITADVDERDVGRLKTGMEALVRADSFAGRAFPAQITQITPQGDSAGRVFRVRMSLASDSPLQPGMTVETNLVVAHRSGVVLVPAKAVRDGSVWVVENGRAHRRPVVLGAAGGDAVEVVKGLQAGEAVIVAPGDRVKQDARVRARSGG